MAIPKASHLWERSDQDWYQEPADCTTALLGVERFWGQIWDPACGGGHVVKAAVAAGRSAFGSDIVDRRWDTDNVLWRGCKDFLKEDPNHFPADIIITNPPFEGGKGTEAFIRHALSSPRLAKLAIFTDVRFLFSKRRALGLYTELPPSRVWVLVPRPSCPPGRYLIEGGKASGGTADFCWLVWDRTAPFYGTHLGYAKRTSVLSLAGAE
jgi:hypothetical protein